MAQTQNLSTLNGLKKIYYALETKDDTESATYDTPKRLGHARSVSIAKEVETVTLYGDNMAVATKAKLKSITLTIETTDIPLEDKAILLGHSIDSTTGAMTAKGDDSAPYVAILFEATKFTGGSRFVKLYKGKFAETQEDINTEGDSMEPQAPSMEGTFIARTFDGNIYTEADSTDEKSASITSAWFDAV